MKRITLLAFLIAPILVSGQVQAGDERRAYELEEAQRRAQEWTKRAYEKEGISQSQVDEMKRQEQQRQEKIELERQQSAARGYHQNGLDAQRQQWQQSIPRGFDWFRP